jgi:hypothetical protein
MDERSSRLVDQLLEKTNEGKLVWTTAFEDGQFKTILPKGEMAFVVQVKGDKRRFLMLDDQQEIILDETLTDSEVMNEPEDSPKLRLYREVGMLQMVARHKALSVNDKLDKAEKLLAAI